MNSSFYLISYSDTDFAGSLLDRKSTSGTCQFLGQYLVSWFGNKQVSVALSTIEVEYVAASLFCSQVLWQKQQFIDYGINIKHILIKCDNISAINLSKNPINLDHILIKCDNTSAINLSKNPIQHSRTKNIDIRHHFLRDHIQT